jgi:hypothetical protein
VSFDILKERIDRHSLTERMRVRFRENGIRTLGDLVKKTEKELLTMGGVGQECLRDTKEFLELFGLSLKQGEQPTKQKKDGAAASSIKIEFSISREKLSRIREDTIGVKSVLTEIFIGEEGEKEVVVEENPGDLDKKYLDFTEFVRKKEIWNKRELANYCKSNKLMLNSVVSVVNDYWDEKYGEHLIEEDKEGFVVNDL